MITLSACVSAACAKVSQASRIWSADEISAVAGFYAGRGVSSAR